MNVYLHWSFQEKQQNQEREKKEKQKQKDKIKIRKIKLNKDLFRWSKMVSCMSEEKANESKGLKKEKENNLIIEVNESYSPICLAGLLKVLELLNLLQKYNPELSFTDIRKKENESDKKKEKQKEKEFEKNEILALKDENEIENESKDENEFEKEIEVERQKVLVEPVFNVGHKELYRLFSTNVHGFIMKFMEQLNIYDIKLISTMLTACDWLQTPLFINKMLILKLADLLFGLDSLTIEKIWAIKLEHPPIKPKFSLSQENKSKQGIPSCFISKPISLANSIQLLTCF